MKFTRRYFSDAHAKQSPGSPPRRRASHAQQANCEANCGDGAGLDGDPLSWVSGEAVSTGYCWVPGDDGQNWFESNRAYQSFQGVKLRAGQIQAECIT